MPSIEVPTTENSLASGSSVKSSFAAEHGPGERSTSGASSERSYLSVLPARKGSLSQRAPAPHNITQGDLSTRQSNSMVVAFDERHTPVFVTTFEGSLDLDAVVWHDTVATKAINAAMSSGRRLVHIVDARRVEVPNAQLRRHWATRIQQSVNTLELMLGTFVVIDSPMLRGALTAIDWLCHECRRIEYFSTLADAVAVANLRLTAVGCAPTLLDGVNYRIAPSLPNRIVESANNSELYGDSKPASATA